MLWILGVLSATRTKLGMPRPGPILTSAARMSQSFGRVLSDEDFETLQTLGHKMRGTGVGVDNFIDSLLGPTTAAPAVPLAGRATRRSLRLTRL